MTLEKFIEQIDELVRGLVKSIDEDYECEIGSDFCVYLDEDLIHWSLLYKDECGQAFYQNFIERFPRAKGFGLFTLSLLHELGHLETEWDMEDDSELDTDSLSNEDYFALHNEKIATDWAGEYLIQHYEDVFAFDELIEAYLQAMYAGVLD